MRSASHPVEDVHQARCGMARYKGRCGMGDVWRGQKRDRRFVLLDQSGLQISKLRLLQSSIRLVTILRDGDVIDDGRGAVLRDLLLLHGHVAGVVEHEAGVSVLE